MVEFQSVGRDITERKVMEEELRERGKKLEHQAQRLEKVNTALKVLLEHREKEIASLLNVSANAVWFHGNNIRKKLGLSRQKANLRSYLQSLSR